MIGIIESSAALAANVPDDVISTTSSSHEYEASVTDDQAPSDYELISTLLDIRAFCHVSIVNARIEILHDEDTRCVSLIVFSGQNSVLHVCFHFKYLKHMILINTYSYGFPEPPIRISTELSNEHYHLHLHVFHKYYSIELNGHEILRFNHRLPFRNVDASEFSKLNRDKRNVVEQKKS